MPRPPARPSRRDVTHPLRRAGLLAARNLRWRLTVRVRAIIAALSMSAVFALAGCGSSDPVSSGPASGSSGHAHACPQPAPAKGKSIDVCAALPATAASQITGTTFTTTKSSSVEGVVFGCDYGGPGSALLQISVDTQDGRGAFDADITALKAVSHPPAGSPESVTRHSPSRTRTEMRGRPVRPGSPATAPSSEAPISRSAA